MASSNSKLSSYIINLCISPSKKGNLLKIVQLHCQTKAAVIQSSSLVSCIWLECSVRVSASVVNIPQRIMYIRLKWLATIKYRHYTRIQRVFLGTNSENFKVSWAFTRKSLLSRYLLKIFLSSWLFFLSLYISFSSNNKYKDWQHPSEFR